MELEAQKRTLPQVPQREDGRLVGSVQDLRRGTWQRGLVAPPTLIDK